MSLIGWIARLMARLITPKRARPSCARPSAMTARNLRAATGQDCASSRQRVRTSLSLRISAVRPFHLARISPSNTGRTPRPNGSATVPPGSPARRSPARQYPSDTVQRRLPGCRKPQPGQPADTQNCALQRDRTSDVPVHAAWRPGGRSLRFSFQGRDNPGLADAALRQRDRRGNNRKQCAGTLTPLPTILSNQRWSAPLYRQSVLRFN